MQGKPILRQMRGHAVWILCCVPSVTGESVRCALQNYSQNEFSRGKVLVFWCFVLIPVPTLEFLPSSTTGFTHVPSNSRDEPIFL